jgi:hypothetical protein
MTRRNPPAKWVLPLVVDPPKSKCYVVRVPLDPYHIAAFLGAMADLCSAYKWADDVSHTARDVARVWRKIVDGLVAFDCSVGKGDEMNFRQNGCVLEFSIDCVNWQVLYDPSECIAERGTQHPPAGDVPVGECKDFDVALQANGYYLLPVPVSGDFTVEVTNARGGWNDGSGAYPPADISAWFCPSGEAYLLGACSGGGTMLGDDPLPSVNHMRLIALIDGIFYDAFNTTINVPSGTASVGVQFQANDPSPGDNSGSIFFHVRVCESTVSTWTKKFDFSAGQQGWDAVKGSFDTDHFVQHPYDGTNDNCVLRVEFCFPEVAHITGVEWNSTNLDTLGSSDIRLWDNCTRSGAAITDYNDGTPSHSSYTRRDESVSGDSIGALYAFYASDAQKFDPCSDNFLYSVTLHGIGPEPVW